LGADRNFFQAPRSQHPTESEETRSLRGSIRSSIEAKEEDTMTTTTLTPRLQVIADKVEALQRMKDQSGFQTKKSIRELLTPLSLEDLAAVAMVVYVK
jgi:hypothetical protein